MKAWSMMAGLGMAAGLVFLVACGGEKEASGVKKQASAKPGLTLPGAMTGKDAMAAKPGSAPAAEAPKPAPFSAEMSAEFMRKVMETSARIEEMKKQIAERQAVIFETNPEVKAYRTQLIEMQKEIGKIMDADPDLTALKLNRDIMWTTMPTLPRGNVQAGPGHGFRPMK